MKEREDSIPMELREVLTETLQAVGIYSRSCNSPDHTADAMIALIAGPLAGLLAERDRLRNREAAIVDRLWAAFGCAPNPDAFKESVRDVLVGEMERFARESENRSSRVDRDNRRLRAQVEAVRELADDLVSEAQPAGYYLRAILDTADGGGSNG